MGGEVMIIGFAQTSPRQSIKAPIINMRFVFRPTGARPLVIGGPCAQSVGSGGTPKMVRNSVRFSELQEQLYTTASG